MSDLWRLLAEGHDPVTLDDLIHRPDWMRDALCREPDHAGLPWVSGYVNRHSIAAMRAVCNRCLARDECLDFALADPTLVGFWAGTGTVERQRLRRQVA